MAISKKVTSPQEIKNQPIKFSKEELSEIKKLQNDISEAIYQLGQVNVNKIKIEKQENQIKQYLSSLEKKEESIAKKLSSKYGKGNLNLDTGEFIPQPTS